MEARFIAKKYWGDQSTPMGTVDQLAKKYDDVINLSLGDPDQTTDEGIIRFAFHEALQGHTHYTDFRGDPDLRVEISKFYFEEYKVNVDDQQIMVTASACLAMYLVLESVLDTGDEVILPTPYFTPYYQQVKLAGGVPVEMNTFEEDLFQIDVVQLEQAITPRTKAIIVNSPSNPTGAVYSNTTLEAVGEIAEKHNLLIISDEIYGAYMFNGTFQSMIKMNQLREQLVIINSFSKDYTMTGWRVGNIIAPPEIIKVCQQVNENLVFTAPSISQRAAIYALRNRKTIQPPVVSLYKERVLYAVDRIKEIPWMSVLAPQGTFYLFINIKNTGCSSQKASEVILDQAQVLTIPGNAFGCSGEGYLRIACTVDAAVLGEAFDRMMKIDWSQCKTKTDSERNGE